MDKSAEKRRGCAGYDPQGCVDFLRRLYPTKTAHSVEADTRLPARTVERWLTFGATPSVAAFARLTVAYGPAFVAAAIPGLAWVERAVAFTTHEGLAREIEMLEVRQAEHARRLFGERA